MSTNNESQKGLRRGAVGLVSVLFMAIANAAPITAMSFNGPVGLGWGNGIGVLANLHLTAGVAGETGSQWVEWPYDPPEWSLDRRDYPLAEPLGAAGGYIALSEEPGLGIHLDEGMLARTISSKATFQ